jgi:hypothetical protein
MGGNKLKKANYSERVGRKSMSLSAILAYGCQVARSTFSSVSLGCQGGGAIDGKKMDNSCSVFRYSF